MASATTGTSSWLSELPMAAAIAALVGLLTVLSVQIDPQSQPHTALRIVGAIALGALLRRRRHLATYLLLFLLAGFLGNLLGGRPWLFAAGAGAIRASEAGIAYWLLRRWGIDAKGLRDVKALAYTGLVAVVIVPMLGGVPGGLLLEHFFDVPAFQAMMQWALSNAMGMLVLLPVILAYTPERSRRLRQPMQLRAMLLMLVATCATSMLAIAFTSHPFILISLPLTLVALRLGLLATSIVCATNTVLVTVAHALGFTRAWSFGANYLASLGYSEINLYIGITVMAPLLISVLLVDRARWARQLDDSRRLMQTVADHVPALIGYLDGEGRYRFVNRVYEEWFGVRTADLEGRTPAQVFGPGLAHDFAPYLEQARDGTTVRFERVLPDGRVVETSIVPDIAAGSVRGMFLMSSDISERKSLEASLLLENQRVQALAQRDHLTGLPNRLSLELRLRDALVASAQESSMLAVLFLDLDDFKPVNDALGHDVGDVLLQHLAARLAKVVRASDTVARMGGDEFVIILAPLRAATDAAHVAASLLRAIRQPVDLDGHVVQVTASIGVALFPQDGSDADALMKHADAAMYRAKAAGTGQYCQDGVIR